MVVCRFQMHSVTAIPFLGYQNCLNNYHKTALLVQLKSDQNQIKIKSKSVQSEQLLPLNNY